MLEFLLGAAAGLVVAFLFLLVVLFRFGGYAPPPSPSASDGPATKRMRSEVSLAQGRKDASPSDIPAYLAGYDETKDVETCAWLDIIMHRVFQSFLAESSHVPFDRLFNRRLRALEIPEFVRPIELTDVNFGTVTPVVQDVKVLSWRDHRPVIMEMRVSYAGDAHASVCTEVVLNVRQKSLASLPVEVAISGIELDAVVQVYLHPSLARPAVSFSFVQRPHVSFKVHSEIGASLALKDLPHLKNILLNAIIGSCRVLPEAYTLEMCGVSVEEWFGGGGGDDGSGDGLGSVGGADGEAAAKSASAKKMD